MRSAACEAPCAKHREYYGERFAAAACSSSFGGKIPEKVTIIQVCTHTDCTVQSP